MRVGIDPGFRLGDADAFHQVNRFSPRLLGVQPAVDAEGLAQLRPHRIDGVQGSQRVLKNDAQLGPIALALRARAERGEVGAVEDNLAVGEVADGVHDPGEGLRCHGLSAP